MYIGIDIGGTKCSVVYGNDRAEILEKRRFQTASFGETTDWILESVSTFMENDVEAIGISCGGPLDSQKGVILGPPNLPGWDEVPICGLLEERFKVPAYLENDADACAVAEWRFGAGQGCRSMVFLTFGTGLGAGLILDGRLYRGAAGMAGEVGHIRLFKEGHVGYGKAGSYEGYCSGGGIAQYGLGSAAHLARLAAEGDEAAAAIWQQTGRHLGRLLALLIDLLDPERIVIGSIFVRAGRFMEEAMYQALEEEALEASRRACTILPAGLGESLGDIAALCVAMRIGTE